MAPTMHTLIDLVVEFGKRYEKVKIDRGIVDFSDLEHYALRILSTEEEGKLVPSDIAVDYRNRFAEVLVDEYQDVKHVAGDDYSACKTRRGSRTATYSWLEM